MLTQLFLLLGLLAGGMQETTPPAQGTPELREGTFEKIIQRRVRLRYLLYLPRAYDQANKKWPLILYLHGGKGRGSDLGKLAWYPLPKLLREPGANFPFVIVMPQCPPDENWMDAEELDAFLEQVISSYAVDQDRVYLAGYSMGAMGAWNLAHAHPERFAALAPMSGFANTVWAARLKSLPIWVFHGAKDKLVPPRESEEIVRALRAEGADVRLSLDPERGHAPPSKEEHLQLFAWFLAQRRPQPNPPVP